MEEERVGSKRLPWWNPEPFLQQQRTDFLSLAKQDFNHWYSSDVWSRAFQRFSKKFLKGQKYEIYVESMLQTCVELASERLPPPVLASMLNVWRSRLERKIIELARQIEWEKQIRESPAGILRSKKGREAKRKIKKWVDAYKVLAKLDSMHRPWLDEMEFFIQLEKGTPTDTDRTPLMLLLDKIAELGRREHVQFNVRNFNETEDIDVHDYEAVEIEITTEREDDYCIIQFRRLNGQSLFDRSYSHLRLAIEEQARTEFGDVGLVVTRHMFGEKFEQERRLWGETKMGKGRPSDDFLNGMILRLVESDVPTVEIRKLVDAFEGVSKKRVDTGKEDKVWSKQEGRYISRYEYNAAKSIQKRIRELGGNSLRYEADQIVKKYKLCQKCVWGWNEKGEFVRVIQCKGGHDNEHIPSVSKGSTSWLAYATKHKPENYFANALSWLILRNKNPKKSMD